MRNSLINKYAIDKLQCKVYEISLFPNILRLTFHEYDIRQFSPYFVNSTTCQPSTVSQIRDSDVGLPIQEKTTKIMVIFFQLFAHMKTFLLLNTVKHLNGMPLGL